MISSNDSDDKYHSDDEDSYDDGEIEKDLEGEDIHIQGKWNEGGEQNNMSVEERLNLVMSIIVYWRLPEWG